VLAKPSSCADAAEETGRRLPNSFPEEGLVMQVVISETKGEMGRRAAETGADKIRAAIARNGAANIVVATGASQFEMLGELVAAPDIDWGVVTAFHLDEYVGMPLTHPASFRKYLKERFVEKLPRPLAAFHYIDGEGDTAAECRRLGALIAAHPVDVAFVGIGENGHLAFNDPPADFETEAPYLVVNLDDACRRQQLGEGWFPTLDDVPRQAISMSIRQILKAGTIVCTVPDARKAEAVRGALEGPVTPDVPASILQRHADTTVFLDPASAAGLSH
jgi:glucosamine-6-phosphate deaminase